MKDQIVASLYIEIKNLGFILVGKNWNNSNNNIEVDSYDVGSEIVKKFHIILKLMFNLLIMITTTVVNVVLHILDILILIFDVFQHILNIITPYIKPQVHCFYWNFFYQTFIKLYNYLLLLNYLVLIFCRLFQLNITYFKGEQGLF